MFVKGLNLNLKNVFLSNLAVGLGLQSATCIVKALLKAVRHQSRNLAWCLIDENSARK